MAFNLEKYLARIGWEGPREPTFQTLAGVLRAHMIRIPFENLDVLLGRPVHIDPDSVYAKLVEAGRGGYCFEHGTLFQTAMRHMGFEPVAHAARVIMVRPRHESPQTHMFLTVAIDDRRYVLDPGFGGQAPLVPVPLEVGEEVRYEGDVHRMVRQGSEWALEGQTSGAPGRLLWSSTLEPAEQVDFVMANHFVSTFPGSPFTTHLMLRAITPTARVSVMNRDVTTRGEEREEKQTLSSRNALRSLLAEHFGFDLPEVEQMRVPGVAEWS